MGITVNLKPEHIPAELRGLLETYETATRIAGDLHQRLAHTSGERLASPSKPNTTRPLTTARLPARPSPPPAIRPRVCGSTPRNAFAVAVDQARANVAAEAALRGAATLGAAARDAVDAQVVYRMYGPRPE
ncbi:hypothetical protein ACFY97_13155 [Streptomyces klenkii]|uniref:hypothetical protein n=1 Tax=Streptomyces klenkii TaxID=1420899 RepID=UPI0036ECC763